MATARINTGNNRRQLPKDQEKLNEAVKAKTTAETTSDLMNEAGLTVAAGEAMRQLGPKAVNPTAAKVITGAGRFAGGGTFAPHLMAFSTGYAGGTLLDKAFNISGNIAKAIFPDTPTLTREERAALKPNPALKDDASQPMPAEYAELAKQGLNPQKPIYKTTGRRSKEIVGYEPLPIDPTPDAPVSAPVSAPQMDRLGDQALDFNQPVVGQGTTAPRQAPLPPVKDTSTAFEGSYLLPSGETMGLVKGGGTRVMTPQEMQQYEMSTKDAPLISGERTAEAPISADGVFMSPSAARQFIPDDPRVKPLGQLTEAELVKRASDLQTAAKESGMSAGEAQRQSQEMVAQYYRDKAAQAPTPTPTEAPETTRGIQAMANFEEFQRSGKEMTPEQVAQAEVFAASMGREFDQEKGYTREFDPAILAEYRRQVEAGDLPSPPKTETDREFMTRQAREAREATEARRAALPAFPKVEEEEEVRGTISVGGKQVPNTEANRILRDQEKALKEAGKREGLRGAELRTFIRDGMKERADIAREETEAKEDREVKKIMDDLNISNAQARLEYNIQRLLPDPPERPDPDVISDFVKTAKDDFGLVFDPETFTFSTVEERTLISDKEHPLNPNSQIYRTLSKLEGAEYLLAPPPDVLDNLDEYVQLAEESENGKAFLKSNDGRVYEVTKDGNVTHTGYSSK